MRYSEDIKPITYLKTQSAKLVRKIRHTRRPVVITQNGEAKIVIQDVESFERDRNALLMLKILSQGVKEADEGKLVDHDVLFDRLYATYFKTGS